MNRLIVYGAQSWLRAFGAARVVAKDAYVNEAEQSAQEVQIDMEGVQPLSVENLEEALASRDLHGGGHA